MKKPSVGSLCLGLATAGLIAGSLPAQKTGVAPQPARQAAPIRDSRADAPDLTVIHVQVLLDRLGFTPGVIDGRKGESLKLALRGFQIARGLKATGEIDRPTLALLHQYRAVRPLRTLAIGADAARGPFVGKLPEDPAQQAKLERLGYANLLEALAERFHTTPETLAALNPGSKLGPGATLRLPNVLPSSRDYPADLPPEWRATLSSLNVDARQPQGALIVVDKSDGVLRVLDDRDRVIAQFPATMGSTHDPLPIGRWKIQGVSYNPDYSYNPAILRTADKGDAKQILPPGPNSPVGVVWLDINKPHYGIHGTPHPETIGRAESNGCIRLTNWDAARLSLMVKAGTPARFQA